MSRSARRRYRETFQISLLGLPGAPATEQVLVAGPDTVLVPLVIQRPLGIVFEERRLALNAAPACVVDEVAPGRCAAVPDALCESGVDFAFCMRCARSNAEKAGVKTGDVLRLTTAVVEFRDKVDTMSYYMQAPAARNRRALLVSDGQPFAKVMKAIISNSVEVDLPDGTKKVFDDVPLVLERAAAS